MKLKSSIRIAMKTKGQLKDLKSGDDSYDTVIQRLLQYSKEMAKINMSGGFDKTISRIEEAEE